MDTIAHRTAAELQQGLAAVAASPSDGGRLEAIVIRPSADERVHLQQCRVSASEGVPGDRWAWDCWMKLDDGRSDPDVQISLINTRLIDLLAGSRERWALAGDNLYVDLDLSRDNLPVGQRLRIGEAVFEITEPAHTGCRKFTERYGAEATQFVNSPDGAALRLRGVYARVVVDGAIEVGDRVEKV